MLYKEERECKERRGREGGRLGLASEAPPPPEPRACTAEAARVAAEEAARAKAEAAAAGAGRVGFFFNY